MSITLDGTNGIDAPAINAGNIVGQVCFFAMTTAPAGFLKANGAAVSRSVYADLFAAIGTTYGAGDGSTTFALPDLRGEFPRGWDDGRGVDSGRGIGTAQGDAIRNITGRMVFGQLSNSSQWGAASSGALSIGTASAQQARVPTNPGLGGLQNDLVFDSSAVVPTAAENRPRNVALLACIKF
jgi:microcystin-dependent protein